MVRKIVPVRPLDRVYGWGDAGRKTLWEGKMTEKKEDDWRRFLVLTGRVKSPDKLGEYFDLFLTFEEREALAKRYSIVKALLEGEKNQRDMSQNLEVSISKITRGSNSLKTISEELRAFLQETMD